MLTAVDAVEVTILVDNLSDSLLPSTPIARRPRMSMDSDATHLRAEHGYGVLITVQSGGRRSSVLYDAGFSRDTCIHNLDVLGVPVPDLRAIALSHGHADHYGGIAGMVSRLGRTKLPLLLHPDGWLERKIVFPTYEVPVLPPTVNDLGREGVEVIEEKGPTLLVDSTILISGQIERVTDFETGFPIHFRRRGNDWEPDFMVWDDQCVMVNVRGEGLVVVSACSHSGVINTLLNARRLCGEERILAFIGGWHLSPASMWPVLDRTLAEFAQLEARYTVPGHCTGWRANAELSRLLGDGFIQSSVGTTVRFEAGLTG